MKKSQIYVVCENYFKLVTTVEGRYQSTDLSHDWDKLIDELRASIDSEESGFVELIEEAKLKELLNEKEYQTILFLNRIKTAEEKYFMRKKS